MSSKMQPGMAEALRLTRAGHLAEASALIQRTLHGMPSPPVSPDGPGRSAAPSSTPSVVIPMLVEIAMVHPGPAVQYGRDDGGCLLQQTPSEVRRDGHFVDDVYTNQAGTRSYKLYLPSGYHGHAVPLVVMLHGCTQTPDDFASGTRMQVLAEESTFLVAYPAQAGTANQSRCWNWFQTAHQRRDRGEPSLIAGITRHIMASYHVDPRRVYVAGMSAGGAMAMIMGVTYPDLYAAIGVHSGVPYGAAHDLRSALNVMQRGGPDPIHQADRIREHGGSYARVVPTIVFHGDQDRTVDQRNGAQVLAQWRRMGSDEQAELWASVSQGEVPAGYSYTRTLYRDAQGQTVLEQWLLHGAGHAWSGGSPDGSFTDPKGPNASQEMVQFFLAHPRAGAHSDPT